MSKNISSKYSQKLVDSGKKSATDAIKLLQKEQLRKTAEGTGDSIGNKIADKITSVSKNLQWNGTQMKLIMKYQKKDIHLYKKDNKLLMN